MKKIKVRLGLILFVVIAVFAVVSFKDELILFVKAVASWQEVDVDNSGAIDAGDMRAAMEYYNCPGMSSCGSGNSTATPKPTNPPGEWTGCSEYSVGTYLLKSADARITPAKVLLRAHKAHGVRGGLATGSPSDTVRDGWFSNFDGWTRYFLRGDYNSLTNIHNAATIFGMQDMYECIGYGAEYIHQAGMEAAQPEVWVPQAKSLASSFTTPNDPDGKCLVYGPSVCDYEIMADPNYDITSISGSQAHTQVCMYEVNPVDSLLQQKIAQVAPYVDIWTIQLGKYQPMVDGGHDNQGNNYDINDFKAWLSKWTSWIKGANPNAKVWAQLGIGRVDPISKACLPPQPPEYILNWREALIESGVDLMWVMPSQPCQPCPANPSPGFPCSNDPQDNEYYLQSLEVFQDAINLACAQ